MKIIGGTDKIDLPNFNLVDIPAKIDTGANRSSIHCSSIKKIIENGIEQIEFHIPSESTIGKNIIRVDSFQQKKIKSSSGHVEERYIINTIVVLFGRRIKTSFSLTNRSEMKFPILLGRKILNKKFLVDVSLRDLSFAEKYSADDSIF